MENQFKFSGSEALELVQTVYPNSWNEKIHEAKEMIKSYMRIYKTTAEKAFIRFRKDGCNTYSAIVSLAALHVMNKNFTDWTINKLQDEQQRFGLQLAALENAPGYDASDKQMLRGFYIRKQDELQTRIDELIASVKVVDPEIVIYQHSIFGNQS